MAELRQTFRPEFLNRIDDIIVFRALTEQDIEEVARRMLKTVAGRMEAMDIHLDASDEAVPDWHFHYLSSDKTQGGHILDLSAERLHLKINRIGRFDLLLPQTTEFAHCELREGKSAAAERFAACQATADKLL